jgi:4-amino-4-deoxy-L-arabinose transferase-like glycosyltransferase
MIARLAPLLASERAIYFLVALFVALGALYSVTTPLFEAGDELWHYPYVQWLARGNGLPIQDPTQKQLWEQEGGQPPLYYALAAASTFWIDTSDLAERLWRNPHAKIGVPLAFGNKNMVVHTSAENFPWQGTTLAVHLIRLLSVLFSAGTVLFTYQSAREILSAPSRIPRPASLALLTASFVACNPMFVFISASVNNDSLAALLATCALYLALRLVTRGVTNRRVLVLGILIGLGILTKVSNLALLIVAISVLAYCAWKSQKFFDVLRLTFYVSLPIVLLDAWWFARNFILYGDPFAFNVWLQIAGGRPPQTLLGLLDEFQGFRISFWGNFGGVNVIAPEWVYGVLDIFSLLAAIGLGIGAVRRALPGLLWIPALHVAIVFVALIRWT